MDEVQESKREDNHLPFFPSDLAQVEVPIELHNEPYAFENEDNEYRMEVLVVRPIFHFYISEINTVGYRVGDIVLNAAPIGRFDQYPNPTKRECRVSILNVYDTYGLHISCSYVNYLYTKKCLDYRLYWLFTYLRCSLLVLRPETKDMYSYLNMPRSRRGMKGVILFLCSLVIAELLLLDSRQLKMIGELKEVKHELPMEVLVEGPRLSSEQELEREENTRQGGAFSGEKSDAPAIMKTSRATCHWKRLLDQGLPSSAIREEDNPIAARVLFTICYYPYAIGTLIIAVEMRLTNSDRVILEEYRGNYPQSMIYAAIPLAKN